MKVKFVDGKWIELEHGSKDGIYIDGLLKKNLDRCIEEIHNDWDYIFAVDGEVGCGKSVLTMCLGWYCSLQGLTLDDITFDAKSFKNRIARARPYSAVIFDEAFRGLSARATMSSVNRAVTAMLNEIRQKNLFVFIVIPSCWDLDKFVLLHRCKGLFHVHTNEQHYRGFWKFYRNTDFFKQFFSNSANRYMYPKLCDLDGAFTKFYPIDEKEYRKKKSDALGTYVEPEQAILTPSAVKRDALQKVSVTLREKYPQLSAQTIAAIIGVDVKTLRSWQNPKSELGELVISNKTSESASEVPVK